MRSPLAWLLCLAVAVAASPSTRAECLGTSATVTAETSGDPGFLGLYKYCFTVHWDLGRYEASHIDVFLGLPDCPCICDARFIRFASPAGHSLNTSVDDVTCELDYDGQYVCRGDPSLPAGVGGPAVKFEPIADATCGPGIRGDGTFCFYSPMPPRPATSFVDALAVKHGLEVCYGTIEGQMPGCDCALPTRPATWGGVKAIYR